MKSLVYIKINPLDLNESYGSATTFNHVIFYEVVTEIYINIRKQKIISKNIKLVLLKNIY